MKKKALFLLMAVLLVFVTAAATAEVKVDEEHFPDRWFRFYAGLKDEDQDGVLCDEEIAAVEELDMRGEDDCYIYDLTGIEYFTSLKKLYVNENRLETLDVSKNKALKVLQCDVNQLTSLNLSKNTALTALYVDYNALKNLNISKNTKLTELTCQSTGLTELDVSSVPALRKLVLETEPVDDGYGHLIWEQQDSTGSAARLKVSKGLEIITDKKKGDIADAVIKDIADRTYTGKAIKPAVTVKFGKTKLVKGTDYTISYKNNKKVGTATVTVKGKGNYIGSQQKTFRINPKPTSLSALTAGKKKLTVKWKKGSGITGYEIQYSLKKNFKNPKTENIVKASATKIELKLLKAEKKYYVRIRTYKKVNGKKYYSEWSAVKNKKTK